MANPDGACMLCIAKGSMKLSGTDNCHVLLVLGRGSSDWSIWEDDSPCGPVDRWLVFLEPGEAKDNVLSADGSNVEGDLEGLPVDDSLCLDFSINEAREDRAIINYIEFFWILFLRGDDSVSSDEVGMDKGRGGA